MKKENKILIIKNKKNDTNHSGKQSQLTNVK